MKILKYSLLIIVGVLLLSITYANGDDDGKGGKVANSPREVQPLLIGAEVPEISDLTKPDGTPFDLKATISAKPTILIFYRGGW